MKQNRNELKAGVLIVMCVILIIGIIIGIKGIEQIVEREQVRTARFQLEDDLGGLRIGDDVRLGGFKVGAIESIDLVQDAAEGAGAQPHILVTFSLPKKYEVREDAVLGVQGTLTGTSWLNFSSLGAGEPLKEGVALVGQPGTMGEIMAALSTTAPKVSGLIDRINEKTLPSVDGALADLGAAARSGASAMKKVEGHIDPIVERYHTLAETGTSTLEDVQGVVNDNRENIRTSVAEVSQRLPGLLDQAETILGDVDAALDEVTASLANLKATSENVKELSATARGIMTSNRGRINAIVRSVKTTGDNLKGASSEIRRSPWRLLYRPKPGEMANLNLFDSAREFAEGASALDDAASALRDALEDPTVDEKRLNNLIQQLDATFVKFGEVEEKLWTEVKE